jgi:hypothetical protein
LRAGGSAGERRTTARRLASLASIVAVRVLGCHWWGAGAFAAAALLDFSSSVTAASPKPDAPASAPRRTPRAACEWVGGGVTSPTQRFTASQARAAPYWALSWSVEGSKPSRSSAAFSRGLRATQRSNTCVGRRGGSTCALNPPPSSSAASTQHKQRSRQRCRHGQMTNLHALLVFGLQCLPHTLQVHAPAASTLWMSAVGWGLGELISTRPPATRRIHGRVALWRETSPSVRPSPSFRFIRSAGESGRE